MDRHPIESLMTTTMENIRDMIDVNTVIGDPVTSADGSTIIPLSRVSFGFVSGGGEYNVETKRPTEEAGDLPFGGGAGAGVSVSPMGFLVISGDQVKMVPAQYYAPIDRIIELVPQLFNEIKHMVRDGRDSVPAPCSRDQSLENPS